VRLTTHLHLVARSKNEWSYTSTPKYVFMELCSVKAQVQINLYILSDFSPRGTGENRERPLSRQSVCNPMHELVVFQMLVFYSYSDLYQPTSVAYKEREICVISMCECVCVNGLANIHGR
jgi:hypothetical protein